MPSLFLVMLGGALGSAARYLTGKLALAWFGPAFPWGTLAVNLIGGLAMGLVAGSLVRLGEASEPWRLLLAVGVLGGFTTFSSFSLELVTMLERGDWLAGIGYVLASVIGAAAAVAAGLGIARGLA